MKRKALPALTLCVLLMSGLMGCSDGGASSLPRASGSPALPVVTAVTASIPAATPAPTPVPEPTTDPDGIMAADGFTVPEGSGLPIGEYALEHGGQLYYCDGDGLWKVDGKLQGKTRVLRTDGAIRQFFFDGNGTLYYAVETADASHSFALYRNGQAQPVAKGFSKVFRADDKRALLLDYRSGSPELTVCNLADGASSPWLSFGTAKEFRFAGGLLYFLDAQDQLIAKDMQTGKRARVFQNQSKLLYDGIGWTLNYTSADGHPVIEAYRYADRTIRTIRLDESILKSFATDSLFYVLAFDGKYLYLCFNGYEYAATFYQVDAGTGKAIKSLKTDQYTAQCVNSGVCYAFTGTYSDGGAPRNLNIWACDMAHGTKTMMKRLPASAGMVDQMAFAGGYIWGFSSTEKKLPGGDSLYLTKCLFTLPAKGS